MIKYKFYATILDAFQNYLSSSEIYESYWGFSENPKLSEEEFEKEQFQSLIDRINRVPFESEPADKGTAFNEVVDCIIEGRKSDKMEINVVSNTIQVKYKTYLFSFNVDLCKDIANRLKGALTQQFVEAEINTKYGKILLYGYMDILMPFKSVDIKTTSKYVAFKFKNNWQHIVYPYCLNQNQIFVDDFEYLVTDFKNIYTEHYVYNREKHFYLLQAHCEQFIEFLNANRKLITDKKIFALD